MKEKPDELWHQLSDLPLAILEGIDCPFKLFISVCGLILFTDTAHLSSYMNLLMDKTVRQLNFRYVGSFYVVYILQRRKYCIVPLKLASLTSM
jgi:hypothetical protein